MHMNYVPVRVFRAWNEHMSEHTLRSCPRRTEKRVVPERVNGQRLMLSVPAATANLRVRLPSANSDAAEAIA